MFARCPKCDHHPLPPDQALPAACPACGVILAKMVQSAQERSKHQSAAPTHHPARPALKTESTAAAERSADRMVDAPSRSDATQWGWRTAMLAGFCLWGLRLISLDYSDGEMATSFIHGPLLIFHEAGHVLFRPFGEWMTIFGGTLGQLLMPALLCGALLLKNRDRFGASIGLWLFGVSLLDVAPYMYDALHPQLVLLSGGTGEDGGHDWIYLFSSMGKLHRAQAIGAATHKLGALVVLSALGWGAWTLMRQRDLGADDAAPSD